MSGLIHIYCGDGKGKTTAAAGLALRASGAGKKVLFAQLLKDGSSSEINNLKKLGINTRHPDIHRGFFTVLNEKEREEVIKSTGEMLNGVFKEAMDGIGLLVLDEIISACRFKLVSETDLIDFLRNKPIGLEVVLTGREPSEELLSLADYVTEMKKIKHPFDKGIPAREGIEF